MMLVLTRLLGIILLLAVTGQAGEGFGLGEKTFPGRFSLREEKLLTADLLSASQVAAAGEPFQIILRLRHRRDAYSYWLNPGGPGQAARFAWVVPPGYRVSEPLWPPPERYAHQGITSYILRGETFLLFTVTPPDQVAAGTEVELGLGLDLQACTDQICVPTHLDLTLRQTLGKETEPPGPLLTRAQARLPVSPDGWDLWLTPALGGADLHLRPGEGANPEPGEISFFEQASGSQRVDSQAAQKLGAEEGGWRLFLPYLPGQGAAGTLTGLLQAPAGWRQDEGQTNYLQVELSGGEALAEPPGGVALTLLFAFLGGLILNIMPCVFPVIGLKILGFARQAGQGRRAVFRQGVFYSLGVVTTFLALAILAITLGRGWGLQLQSPWFIYVLGQLFLAISLNLAGVFMVGGAVSGGLGSRAFASGLLAVLAATPCSAPFLGTALAYALTLPPLMALGLFLLMGIGFALPYLVLALFPGLLKYLPRPGPWLETFRQAMSFPLFATVGYLLWTLAGMTDEGYFLLAILGLVLAAFAWWLYGHGQLTGGARWRGRLLALLLLLLGWWLGLPGVKTGLVWEEWSPDRVAEYRHAGRPVLVDFTARWCATCQVNKLVWTDPRIAESLAERGVALLRADWTLEDPRITRALRDEFSRVAIPLVALYLPEGGSPQILPDLLTSGDVLSALALLPPREDAIF